MKEYLVCKSISPEYDGFLLCLTYESIINYLEAIETEPLISEFQGTLLIDQLLVTGNGRNRFIACSFSYGKINISTARNVSPNNEYKQLAVDLLNQHFSLLHNSILTEKQRNNIKNNIPF